MQPRRDLWCEGPGESVDHVTKSGYEAVTGRATREAYDGGGVEIEVLEEVVVSAELEDVVETMDGVEELELRAEEAEEACRREIEG